MPHSLKPLLQPLLDARDKIFVKMMRAHEAYLAAEARRAERRERGFARRDWTWLGFMIFLLSVMVLMLHQGRHEMLPDLALLCSLCLIAYVLAQRARRRIAAKDQNDGKGRHQ